MSEPLRVCDLVQFYSPISGGVKRFIGDKCRYLASIEGIEHSVVVPGDHDGLSRWEHSRCYTVDSPLLLGSASYRVLYDRQRLRRILTTIRPHIIEVGDPYLTAWIGRRLARQLSARIVGFYHSDHPRAWWRVVERRAGRAAGRGYEWMVRRYLRALYRGMDAVVVAAPPLEKLWRQNGVENVRLIPLGVDTEIFCPRPAARSGVRARWGIPETAPVILFAGRLAREKRVDWLLQVWRQWVQARPDLHLVWVGDGEWRGRVERWAKSDARLRWQPYLQSAEKLAEVYSAADVLMHAGLGETFGLSVLEAQACGLPVVAALDSGLDDTVLPLPGSALVPAEDLAAWLAAGEGALRSGVDPEMLRQRQAAVKARFAWWRTYEGLVSLYRELAARPQKGRV